MNIEYMEATLDDAWGIDYVAAHSWKETYTGLVSDEYLDMRVRKADNKDPERIEKTQKFLSQTTNYFVAKEGDKVVGIMHATNGTDEYDGYGRIGAIYVLKEYQGYGIGKNLFKIGLEKLIEMGYDKMMLECMVGNKTLSFYQKYGGHIVDTIDYKIADETVKADILVFDNIKDICDNINNSIKR